ncbi:dTDP-4-dehydrorhamnose reductase [Mizugakiibacter sediminis]|uniref:dTDP-4-dehydrorhamnose reductase n=1 Tax=Mizugakiibacter sediminis TaxID=1475481 RepID=A0A0K8QJY2_9GAMM|nr:dTDP-4-dehydrorhamnose reductase [Mizugakiibacter sediminis]GAP65016.1 dTDP-4-dehydrorhamnose reductase [Mizugakiibacter sediminis]
MRLLLLGANGQVGFELLRALAPLGDVTATTRGGVLPGGGACERADLDAPATLPALLDRAMPRVIVNAAAYTAVDRAEDEPEAAMRANGEAPGVLGRWAARHGALVVHYSTDYVFDGSAARPYREDDPPGPLGAYGRSKWAGEQALRASGADHLILRTAWVYAARGHNFLRTMLRLAGERERLAVVDDQHGAPTSARLIAAATAAALARWLDWDAPRRRAALGTHHLVASGRTTWCDFARAIFAQAAAAGVIARAPRVEAIPTRAYPTQARRPAWSVLDTTRLRETFGLHLPEWRDDLTQVVGELA